MRTTVDEIKAELRAEFRDWSIITTDAGRWWATRGPKRGDQVQAGASCVDADTAEELRARLIEVCR
ncbi:hypothetical protein J4573_42720 [Actinomadura barringtoniae]|uniref:Uncharacterized protein n=1 Tax=Actinomadura barringtoniae TaxID=1427535 RepID=A0A939PJG9_9ACTN|nr:hypothetical protein [Actinomadura barringtoniae]MBO2453866.1 hypothetical protein [Actinomadura barringtoniae]